MNTAPVPHEIADISIVGEDYNRDPHAVIDRARRQGPIARSERGWEVLCHETAQEILRDNRLLPPDATHALARGASDLMADFVMNGLLLDMDPERHRRIRRIMMGAFALRRIDERKDIMHAVAHGLLDDLTGHDKCNFIAEFSHLYSIRVLCSLLGVDEADIPQFAHATTELRLMSSLPLAPALPRIDAALQALWDYSERLVEQRRVAPRDDFISALIEIQSTEGKLSKSELIWGIANLLFAGHETTRNQLATAMRAFSEHPEAWEAMKGGREAITSAMYESIRYYPVVFNLRRVAHEAACYDGVTFAVGDTININFLAVSHDPEQFAEPHSFQWDREPDAFSINFGFGTHMCLGHALAKAEMIEALTVLRQRWDHFHVSAELVHTPYSGALGGVLELPLSIRA